MRCLYDIIMSFKEEVSTSHRTSMLSPVAIIDNFLIISNV